MARRESHIKTLMERAEKKKKEANDLAMAGVRQQERRAQRKIERETRAKEQSKAQTRAEIHRILI